MAGIIEIELSQLRFFSHHGLYAEEAKLGAWFEVTVFIRYATGEGCIEDLNETIDYVTVYEMVKEQIGKRSELLETTAIRTASLLKERFEKISSIRISIKKLAPPITNFIGDVSVTYERMF